MTEYTQQRLLSRKEAAEFLNIKEETLAVWKCTHKYQLPVIKVGRLCRYRMEDLQAFISRRTVCADTYAESPLTRGRNLIVKPVNRNRPQ